MSIIKIVNATTGEEIEREMTAEELAEYEARQLEISTEQAAREAEAAQLAAAKQAAQDKLKALGLTDLEIAALTGA